MKSHKIRKNKLCSRNGSNKLQENQSIKLNTTNIKQGNIFLVCEVRSLIGSKWKSRPTTSEQDIGHRLDYLSIK